MKKKVLFFVMTFVMSALLIPNVYAEGVVAKIGSDEYSTLQQAVNAVENGDTITLVANTNEDITIAADKKFTLDLGTYTLTNVSSHTIVNNGDLTITGAGTIDNISHGTGALVNKGTVTVLSGTFTRSHEAGSAPNNSGSNSWYVIDNNGTNAVLTFKGGKVINTSKFSSLIRNLGAKLFVEDGTFENDFIVLKNDDNGTMEISGGKVSTKGSQGSAVQNWGNFALSGGELNAAEGSVAIYASSWDDRYTSTTTIVDGTVNGNVYIARDGNYAGAAPEVAITGGDVVGSIKLEKGGKLEVVAGNIGGPINADSTSTVKTVGGTYTSEPSEDMVPEGYKVFDNEDGTYTIAKPVNITFNANGNEEVVEVPVGSILTEEELEELKEALMAELEGTNIRFDGFFRDENFEEEFDFSEPFEADTTIYLKLSEVLERGDEKENPNTADVNMALILGALLIGGAGLGFTLKNRKFN